MRTFHSRPLLGPLELQVMVVTWNLCTCSVRDVVDQLPQRLAYTTIMTTLVRLFRKGMVRRTKEHNKFVYSPTCTELQWQEWAADEAAERFLTTQNVPRKLLVSSLRKAMGEQEPGAVSSTEESGADKLRSA